MTSFPPRWCELGQKAFPKLMLTLIYIKKFCVALVFCAQMSNPLWNLGLSYKSMQAKMLGWVTFKKLLRYPFKYSATQICILCIASLFFVKNKFLISPIYCNVSTKSECCLCNICREESNDNYLSYLVCLSSRYYAFEHFRTYGRILVSYHVSQYYRFKLLHIYV